MSNSNQNKPSKPFPPSLRLKEEAPVLSDAPKIIKPEFPAEAKALDGVALASLQPTANQLADAVEAAALPDDHAGNTEFHLHEDGTLCKYVEREKFAPTCSVVDGRGQVLAVAKNAAVADMICNAVNSVNLAMQQIVAQDQEKRAEHNPGEPRRRFFCRRRNKGWSTITNPLHSLNMSDNKTVVHSHSFPIVGLLGVVFITLKLCGIISWPWLWVLAPFWLGLAIILALCVLVPLLFLVVAGLFAAIAGVFAWIAKKFND